MLRSGLDHLNGDRELSDGEYDALKAKWNLNHPTSKRLQKLKNARSNEERETAYPEIIDHGRAQVAQGNYGAPHEQVKREALAILRRRKAMSNKEKKEPHIKVLLLQEDDGWIAMCELEAKMREVRGPTIEATQEALRALWANPLPLRFPEDFPLMHSEFATMKSFGTLHETDETFTWYVLDLAARERCLRSYFE